MADVKSKNPYELLGNDPEEDSDREAKPPTKAVDKPLPRSGKRAPLGSEPVARGADATRGGRGGRRPAPTGSEAAFNDSAAGSRANRAKPAEEGGADRPPRRGGVRGQRGGRGGTFKDSRDDRHWKGLPHDHTKQADQSWGGNTGNSEWADERAGEAIAQSEAQEGGAPSGATDAEAEAEPEPEDHSKTLDDYKAEQAAKRAGLGEPLAARKANEGSKQDKKWAQAKALQRDEHDDSYMAPQGGKTARQRERKERQVVEIDHRFVEQPRDRGGYRGGRGRGDTRGDIRGGGRGRGEFRGGRGGESRGGRAGESRGRGSESRGRGGRGANVNVADTNAFPSLGS